MKTTKKPPRPFAGVFAKTKLAAKKLALRRGREIMRAQRLMKRLGL